MEADKRTAVVVGVLFIWATVASILGSAALGSILEGSDYLGEVATQETRLILAVLLFLTAAGAAVTTAFLLFPILRRHAEGAATGYVVLRTFENVLYVAGVVALLIMLSVSQSEAITAAAAPERSLLGVALLGLHDWSTTIGTMLFFGLGCWALNVVLYRSRLVPRWLSVWGLAGAVLVFAYGILGLFGLGVGLDSPLMLLAMPIAFQEMVFAGWLIVRGFDHPLEPEHLAELRVEVMS
jgi:hypothetical protein